MYSRKIKNKRSKNIPASTMQARSISQPTETHVPPREAENLRRRGRARLQITECACLRASSARDDRLPYLSPGKNHSPRPGNPSCFHFAAPRRNFPTRKLRSTLCSYTSRACVALYTSILVRSEALTGHFAFRQFALQCSTGCMGREKHRVTPISLKARVRWLRHREIGIVRICMHRRRGINHTCSSFCSVPVNFIGARRPGRSLYWALCKAQLRARAWVLSFNWRKHIDDYARGTASLCAARARNTFPRI